MSEEPYKNLENLATALDLSKRYLRELAEARKIPGLLVGGRWRFDAAQVREALRRLAEQGVSRADD